MILEEDKPLSQSILWRLQRNFYNQWGIRAWQRGVVPHHVTSNAYLARAYGRLVLGFMRDWYAAGSERGKKAGAVQPGLPLYIVELGSGSGRLAYHFVKKFQPLHERSRFKGVRWKYVLTDVARANLDFWQTHPPLLEFAEAGLLDFAHFDAEQPADLRLEHSGEALSRADGTANPMVVVANYFFDSIPQDSFTVEGGALHENLATVSSPNEQEENLDDPGLLSRVKVKYKKRPAPPGYYGDPDLDAVLEAARERPKDTLFLFPTAGLRVLRHFRDLSGDRLLVIAGDKGYGREADLPGPRVPHIAKHGSISMMVNYPALGQYVVNQGGQAMSTSHRHANLNVSAFLLGDPPEGYVETAQAYDEAVEQGGPDDLFTLKHAVEDHVKKLDLEGLLALLRLTGWDNRTFNDCFEAVLDKTGEADDDLKEEVWTMAAQVWDMYYDLGEDEDLPFDLGRLLYTADYYEEALALFERSLRDYGPAVGTYYNIGLCQYQLGNLQSALNYVEQALELDPTYKAAQAKRAEIRTEMEEQPAP